MEKLNFTKEEKELLKEMYEMFKKNGKLNISDAITKGVAKQNCIVIADYRNKNMLFFNFKKGGWTDKNNLSVCKVFSVLYFFKRLYEEKLIHIIVSKPRTYDFFGLSELKQTNKTNLLQGRFNDEDVTIDTNTHEILGYAQVPSDIDGDLYDMLKTHGYVIFDSKLLHYIENGFETEDEKQLFYVKLSNLITFVTAIAAIAWNIYVAYYVPTAIKDDNIDSLRQSIESTKSVKVENDTFAINAKVDTVTVKPVDVINVKSEDTKKK